MIKEDIKKIPSIQVLGSKVHMVQIPQVVKIMSYWIESEPQKYHWVVNTGMHGLTQGYKNPEFKKILNSADLFTPDGKPLNWLGRYLGFPLENRVCAADLMKGFFKLTSEKGYRNFFYGDTDQTLELLTQKLSRDFPNLKIAGAYSPPFRDLSPREEAEIMEMINNSGADVLWVALGLPKQERWMFEHRDRLEVPVAVGIGASFKFLSGKVKRAPTWIGESGFEWLWRFLHEPKRLWRRVLLDMPLFVSLVFSELLTGRIQVKKG